MSAATPEPVGLRQRATVTDEADEVKTANPSSLSGNSKDVMRNKPVVKPPFADVPMSKFLVYLSLGLIAIASFYTWRFTVYAASVGGYWNVMTGKRPPPVTPGDLALSAAGSVASGAASKVSADADSAVTSISSKAKSSVKSNSKSGKSTPNTNTGSDEDVQSQIFNLALALGVKPHELSAAIRPLIDPTVPNPAEQAQREAELLKAQIAAGGAVGGAAAKEEHGPGLLAALGEALLD